MQMLAWIGSTHTAGPATNFGIGGIINGGSQLEGVDNRENTVAPGLKGGQPRFKIS